jgi:RNA-directed DNA polymerase
MNIFIKNNFKISKKINWCSIQKKILRLQNRIVKQLNKKNFRSVRNLQRLLIKSYATQLLISQKLINKNSINKFNLYKKNNNSLYLHSLNLNNFIQLQNYNYEIFNEYNQNYLKFLSLLWVLALIPINETLSDPLSYNYRLYRTQADIVKEFYSIFNFSDSKWLLIIKPAGFFKAGNEKWLIKNLLLEKKILQFNLKNEKFAKFSRKYYNHKEIIETKKISLIKLIRCSCFYGFEKFKEQALAEFIPETINKDEISNIPIIYYSNMIFVPSNNLAKLKRVYKLIFQFLNSRGLTVKKNRLWVINLSSGFNFLGWSLKKEKNRTTMTISRENIKSHQLDIKKFLKSARFLPIDKVIIKLNKKITNWQDYYSYTPNLYKICSEMNYYLFWRVWRWCKKRHKNKGAKWLYNRYWFYNEKNKWVFHFNQQYLKKYELKHVNIINLPGSINACEIKNWKTNQNKVVSLKNLRY